MFLQASIWAQFPGWGRPGLKYSQVGRFLLSVLLKELLFWRKICLAINQSIKLISSCFDVKLDMFYFHLLIKNFFIIFVSFSGKFDVLGHQMDPSSNFVTYRTTLQERAIFSIYLREQKIFFLISYCVFGRVVVVDPYPGGKHWKITTYNNARKLVIIVILLKFVGQIWTSSLSNLFWLFNYRKLFLR